jgi:hypothetical protein
MGLDCRTTRQTFAICGKESRISILSARLFVFPFVAAYGSRFLQKRRLILLAFFSFKFEMAAAEFFKPSKRPKYVWRKA